MKKILYCILILLAVVSCSSQNEDLGKHVGLYEIVKSSCEVNTKAYNPCEYTLFFEIVKGQFIGISNNEIGYVFWSGDPKIDPELQYSSHIVNNYHSRKIEGNRYYLSGSKDSEYLVFSAGKLTTYHAIYEENDESTKREITYELKAVKRGNLPNYRLNYPGNQ